MFEKQKPQTNILVIFMTSDPCLGHPYWHLPCHSQWRGYLCLPMSPPPLLPPDEIINSISYGPIMVISRESLRSSLLCCCLPHPHQENHLQNYHHQLVQPEEGQFFGNSSIIKLPTSSVHSKPGGDLRGANRGVSSGYPGNGAT